MRQALQQAVSFGCLCFCLRPPWEIAQECFSLLMMVITQWLCQRTQESIITESFFCPAPWIELWFPVAASACFQLVGQSTTGWRVRRKQDQVCCTRVSQAGPDSTVQFVVGSYMKSTPPLPVNYTFPNPCLCIDPSHVDSGPGHHFARDTNKYDVSIAWIHTCLHWDLRTSV